MRVCYGDDYGVCLSSEDAPVLVVQEEPSRSSTSRSAPTTHVSLPDDFEDDEAYEAERAMANEHYDDEEMVRACVCAWAPRMHVYVCWMVSWLQEQRVMCGKARRDLCFDGADVGTPSHFSFSL
jgi:hypothetical protein